MTVGESLVRARANALGATLDVCSWHVAAFAATHHFVAYWTNNGQVQASALISYAANDPKPRFPA